MSVWSREIRKGVIQLCLLAALPVGASDAFGLAVRKSFIGGSLRSLAGL